jgi:hypothetical protein
MKKKLAYIPTLQAYAKVRKRLRDVLSEINKCSDCDYYRKDIGICIWNDNIKEITKLQTCPLNNRVL